MSFIIRAFFAGVQKRLRTCNDDAFKSKIDPSIAAELLGSASARGSSDPNGLSCFSDAQQFAAVDLTGVI